MAQHVSFVIVKQRFEKMERDSVYSGYDYDVGEIVSSEACKLTNRAARVPKKTRLSG